MTMKYWLTGAGIAVAAGVVFYAFQAKAADLGGSCCSDLEERVAELEASTVRKGNRKVTVKISGQVNKALLYVNSDYGSESGFIDNLNSPSRIRVDGEAKMGAGYSAGFLIELSLGSPEDANVQSSGITGALSPLVGGLGEMTIRHNAVWVGTPMGKVWLGHTGSATDGIVEINLANVNVVALPAASWLGFDGSRTQVLKYQSASLAGFEFQASLNDSLLTDTNSWDAALRYAGEGAGFRFAAGLGYADNGNDVTRLSGSASLMHVVTGLFATINAGKIDGGGEVYGGTAGIERNWFGIGRTTIFGEYSVGDDVNATINPLGIYTVGPIDEVTVIGLGAVQAVDSLGLDLYANWRQIDVGEKADVFMAGMRVTY